MIRKDLLKEVKFKLGSEGRDRQTVLQVVGEYSRPCKVMRSCGRKKKKKRPFMFFKKMREKFSRNAHRKLEYCVIHDTQSWSL